MTQYGQVVGACDGLYEIVRIMRKRKMNRAILVFLGSLISAPFFGCDKPDDMETVPETPIQEKKEVLVDPNFHIYLCFGQSNMEGSAKIESQDRVGKERFQMMQPMTCTNPGRTEGRWYTAIPPLSQCGVGLSPADYFGRTMTDNLPDSIRVGVISVAIGGCDIRLFDKDQYQSYLNTYSENWFQDKITGYGGNPYQRLIDLAKKAQKDGVIKGILLHQGETNTGNAQWPTYVKTIYENMMTDLSLDQEAVPLLAGEVVHADQGGVCASMNEIIATLPEVIPTAHVISSSGCTAQADSVHFDSEGVRELGERYALRMLSLQGN